MQPADRAVQLPIRNSNNKYGLAIADEPMQTPHAVGQ